MDPHEAMLAKYGTGGDGVDCNPKNLASNWSDEDDGNDTPHKDFILDDEADPAAADADDGDRPTGRILFGDVTVYELPLRIGDNPAVSSGAPIRVGGRPIRE